MLVTDILNNRQLKSKEKTLALAQLLLENKVEVDELTRFAENTKETLRATCIEALEHATKQSPSLLTRKAFEFVTVQLAAAAPRVKWESARVIGNTAHLFKNKLNHPITDLLKNAQHEGTVVRWSAAFALAEIIKLKTKYNKTIIPAAERIIKKEVKASIRKIYLEAIKKATK